MRAAFAQHGRMAESSSRRRWARRWRRWGDAARDRAIWRAAAIAYRRHLARDPADAPIHVQLGHVERALGNAGAAEAHYRTAMAIAPGDADTPLMLGHLLKVSGRAEEAFDAYLASHRLSPGGDAADELRGLRWRVARPVETASAGAVLLSIQDLFLYLHHHPTMSGIQRVQAGIALHALDEPALDARFIVAEPGAPPRSDSFLAIAPDALGAIIRYAAGAAVDHAWLKAMLVDAELTATRVRAGPGSTVMLLGAFWAMDNPIDRYVPAKQAGARIGAYIYDVIPVTHPDFCVERLARDFAMALADLWEIVDFVFTISDATARELARLMAARGRRTVPSTTVPLAHAFGAPAAGGGRLPPVLEGRPYVAYVSTIEARKNHIWLVRAWRRLIADGVDVPDLVFAGRPGWRVAPLMALLDGTDRLGGRVHLLHGLSDAELDAVYRGALFTAFTSLVEGWGLPVGESLAAGTPCVASAVSSIPEVGGDFVDYVDPADLDGGVAVLRRMIEDAGYRAARRRLIAERFVARDWHDVGRDFVAALKRVDVSARPLAATPLAPGAIVRPAALAPGAATDVDAYWRSPARMMLVDGFHPADADGARLLGVAGALRFATPFAAGTPVLVELDLRSSEPGGRGVTVTVGGDAPERARVAGPARLRVPGRVDGAGVVGVTLAIDGEPPPEAGRRIALGLDRLSYVEAGDPVSAPARG